MQDPTVDTLLRIAAESTLNHLADPKHDTESLVRAMRMQLDLAAKELQSRDGRQGAELTTGAA